MGVVLTAVAACGDGGVVPSVPVQTIATVADATVARDLEPALVLIDGEPLVLYYDASVGAVYAAYPDESSWTTTLIDGGGDQDRGRHLRAVVASDGTVFAAYRDEVAKNIRLLSGAPASWTTLAPLPDGEDRGNGLDIALDLSDNPWIVYRNGATQAVEVVLRSAGAWLVERVDTEGNTGFWPRIAADLGGRMHVIYHNASEGSLRYAKFVGPGQWDLTTIEPGGSGTVAGTWTALGLRPGFSGDLALAFPRAAYVFQDAFTYTLKYAEPDTTGVWTAEFVDEGIFGGTDSCMVVADDGTVYLAFLDNLNLDLRIARRRGGSWQVWTQDAAGAVGYRSACALDATGRLHLVYASKDETSGELRYTVVEDR